MVSAGSGPRASMPSRAQLLDGGRDDAAILLAERAVLAGVRVEAGEREPRPRDAEALASDRARRCGRSRRSDPVVRRLGTSRTGKWIVTGTTASSSRPQHHHRVRGTSGVLLRELGEEFGMARARQIRCGRAPPWRPDW